MKKIDCFAASICLCLLSGCSTLVNGSHQTISVSTPPAINAQCILENDKGKWYLNQTPGNVVVHRSFKNLQVLCKKPGYSESAVILKSRTQAATFGNILFGGIPGAAIDIVGGAAYAYPLEVTVPLRANTRK